MQILSKSNQFSAFLKSANFFQTDLENKKSTLLRELVTEVDSLIVDGNKSCLATVIKKGYNLSAKQCWSYMSLGRIGHDLNENEIIIRENIIKVYDNDDSIQKKIILDMQKIENTLNSYQSRNYKINKIAKLWQTRQTIHNYFSSDFMEVIYKDDNFFLEFFKTLKSISTDLNLNIEKDRYKNFNSRILNDISFEIFHQISDFKIKKKELINTIFNEKLEKYNILFEDFSNVKNSISEDVLKTIKNFDEKNLPQEIQDVISSLKSTYKEISPQKLSVEQELEINNLYKKRFPQVLEEYILISPRYREKLTEHNESPDKLLLESLVEIKIKLNIVFENLQEINHIKLKVTNKYLKSL